MKHPDLKNEAPKARKRSTQISKMKHPRLENEAPKSRNHCRLKNYNFKSCMTQDEPGGGNVCVRTSKGPQMHSKFLDRKSSIIIVLGYLINHLNMHFFSTHTCLWRHIGYLWHCVIPRSNFQNFFRPENLGSHIVMSTDDRFLPQSSATHTLARAAEMHLQYLMVLLE